MLNDVCKPQQQHGPLGHCRQPGTGCGAHWNTGTGCWPWPTQSKASNGLELDPLS